MDDRNTQAGLPDSSRPGPEAYDHRTIAEMNSHRKPFRVVARAGFVVAAAMFLLPPVLLLVGAPRHALAIVCMTAAWAVLVSASSFAVMGATRAGGHPWVHQLWAVPVAIVVMVPGAMTALLVYGLVDAAV